MKASKILSSFSLMVGMMACVAGAQANSILNGDFETGTYADWTLFTNPGGTLGPSPLPDINLFDVTGSGATNAARVQIGSAGGGISQVITVGAGLLSVSANIAAWDSNSDDGANADWGTFQLLIDGTVVDTVSFGSPTCCDPVRDSLNGSLSVGTGSHEIEFLVTRGFATGSLGATPFEYIDNVVADGAAVAAAPAPATLVLFGLGLAALGWSCRKR